MGLAVQVARNHVLHSNMHFEVAAEEKGGSPAA